MTARVLLVAARAADGTIGDRGGIPWRIPADFAHFKRTTLGHPLVLGRTTFEGIGRPLPGRQSIVVTSDPGWSHPGVLVARSVPEALDLGQELDPELVCVGGGARVYADALARADEQVLTEVDLSPGGDTRYPAFDEDDWHETRRGEHPSTPGAPGGPDAEPAYVVRWLERVAGRDR